MYTNPIADKNKRKEFVENYTPVVMIYADGSCLRNGASNSSAGAGAVIVDRNRGEVKLHASYLGSLTNQQAEIVACTKALGMLSRSCRIEIFSDSKYVIETMAGKNRMKTNRPFWSELVEGCLGHHLTWRWVKGHSGDAHQEVADRLSRASANIECDIAEPDLDQLTQENFKGTELKDMREFEARLRLLQTKYLLPPTDNVVPSELCNALPFRSTYPSAFV